MTDLNFANLTALLLIIGLTLLFLFVFLKPLIYTTKFVIRGTLYSILMFLINLVTGSFGFTVGLNLATSCLCGLFGIYGVILNYGLKILFM